MQGAIGYDVEVDGNIVDNGSSLYYINSGLANGSQHSYRVRAKNTTGTGEWSSLITSTANLSTTTISSVTTLNTDMIYGNLSITNGTFDLNKHRVIVLGSVTQSGGTLNVDGGSLTIAGDYKITNGSNTCYAVLQMTNSADYIYVGGDFVTQLYYDESNDLTAGILEIKGNFTQKYGNGDRENFAASGTNKVILSGSGTQTVSFDNPGDSCFNILQLSNTNGIVLCTAIAVNNLLGVGKINSSLILVNNTISLSDGFTINGDLNLQSGTLNINGNILTVTGNLVLSGGTIDLSQGEIDVDKSLSQNGGQLNVDNGYLCILGDYTLQNNSQLVMTKQYDYVFVNGNFTTNTNYSESDSLSDGILEIEGNFTQGGNDCSFAASNNNMVILSGSSIQNIYFANPQSSYFSNIDVSSSSGVKCNYTKNIDVTSSLNNLPDKYQVNNLYNILLQLGSMALNAYLDKSVNAFFNLANIQYSTRENIGYFIYGFIIALDDNLLLGLAQRTINLPEDNYYYMLGKTLGDQIFLATFLTTAKTAAANIVAALGEAGGFGEIGLALSETGVGFAFFETAAGAAVLEAGISCIVACVAGAQAGNSADLLKRDTEKLNATKEAEGAAEAISKGKIEHVLKDHTYGRMKDTISKMMQNGLRESAEELLNKESFFNPSWSEEKVIDATNQAYKEALSQGFTNGEHTVKVFDENITVYLENGEFHSAYGDFKLTLSDFGY